MIPEKLSERLLAYIKVCESTNVPLNPNILRGFSNNCQDLEAELACYQSLADAAVSGKVTAEKHVAKVCIERDRLRDRCEQQEIQMAGISVAALGGTKDPATRDQWGWSVPYQDVLNLRIAYDRLRKDK